MKNKIISIDCFDQFVSFTWNSGEVDSVSLRLLRLSCPCAFCSGESDVFGNIYKGEEKQLASLSFTLKSYSFVGLYGLRLVWGDGHSDGIYVFDFLKHLAMKDNVK